MPIAGKVYILPVPSENSWQLVVENTGTKPFGVTQNILPAHDPDRKAHDDHVKYGHGLPVNAGAVSWQKFIAGDMYNGSHVIDDSCFLRVGLRNLAYKTVRLPAMHEGPLELDVAEFNWYGGDAGTADAQVPQGHKGDRPRGENARGGPALVRRIQQSIALGQTDGITCKGSATVSAVRGKDGALSHWELRFHNESDQAFIGTCSFVGANKNDGLGLEAMGLPNKNSAAMQRIEAYGNYGVDAAPGAKLRLGVRGYAWVEIPLPRDGEVVIPIDDFKVDARQMSADFFDKDNVTKKRDEKVAKVQFFEGRKAINAELKPKLWKGEEARARSTFDAPSLVVTAVAANDNEHPGGGFLVELRSQLPEFVEDQRAGFVAAIRLAGSDTESVAAQALRAKKFEYPGHTQRWFIPMGADCGGVKAKPGVELQVATRGLGWTATLALPKSGAVNSDNDDTIWGLREDQESKRLLKQSYVARLRDS